MSALVEATGLGLTGRLLATDVAVERPALVCLVGPNGSGKTSLLHALAGIGSPAGSVRIAGENPDRLAPAARKRLLAYLPASRDIAWPVAARDLIRLGGGSPAALDELEIGAFAERRIDRLSTGERSRVLIARALAQRAKLLLLDEPAANLDPAWQIRLMARLREEARTSVVIAAMHDLDMATLHAERLIVMDRGRIAADGPPAEILSGDAVATVFAIERGPGGRWRLVSPSADPRSSP